MSEMKKPFRETSEKERLKTLDLFAAKGKGLDPLPNDVILNMPEVFYFLTMRSLYAMRRLSAADDSTLKKEKQMVMQTYRAFELVNRIGEQDMQILRRLQHEKDFYQKDGCPKCKRLYDELSRLIEAFPEEVEVII